VQQPRPEDSPAYSQSSTPGHDGSYYRDYQAHTPAANPSPWQFPSPPLSSPSPSSSPPTPAAPWQGASSSSSTSSHGCGNTRDVKVAHGRGRGQSEDAANRDGSFAAAAAARGAHVPPHSSPSDPPPPSSSSSRGGGGDGDDSRRIDLDLSTIVNQVLDSMESKFGNGGEDTTCAPSTSTSRARPSSSDECATTLCHGCANMVRAGAGCSNCGADIGWVLFPSSFLLSDSEGNNEIHSSIRHLALALTLLPALFFVIAYFYVAKDEEGVKPERNGRRRKGRKRLLIWRVR